MQTIVITGSTRGIGKGLGIHSSGYQCTQFMILADLPPGRYRLVALEGRISSITLTRRFREAY